LEEVTMRTASQVLRDEGMKPRLSTGCSELDRLIDGVRLGQFYLFYGDDEEVLDLLVHKTIINSVLPPEEGGFGSRSLYVNMCNYHQGKTILNPSFLAILAKSAGLDPSEAFGNILSVSAFNEAQQLTAASQVSQLVYANRDVKLVVLHNLTRFVETSRRPLEARQILKQVVGILRRAASENDAALIAICRAAGGRSRGRIPKPEGGTFLRHEANVIVHFRKMTSTSARGVRATLVKHSYKETPRSIILYVQNGGVNLMGRITPSFRQLYHRQVEELRRSNGFQNTLLDLNHKEALDSLIREAWSPEGAALSQSGIPCVLDVLNLMANVHNKKVNNALRMRIEELEKRLNDLTEKESQR
jgi:hypothetical protein